MKKNHTISHIWSKRMLYTAFIFLLLLLGIHPLPVQAAPGVDGSFTVTTANTILNRYTTVASIAGNTVTVSNIADLNDGNSQYTNNTLSTGDMILIYQAQGASFTDTSDTATWGAFSYNSAGSYEFAVVANVTGNNITVDAANSNPYSCGGISNAYDTTNGNVQVLRVPQYSDLTINSGASVVAQDWNGSSGGVVAIVVQNSMIVDGDIDVSGQGFRGGVDINSDYFLNISIFRTTDNVLAADKGESILGYQGTYDTAGLGRYGRGAPANGGGGGNDTNSGGGGGANGDNGGTWTGQGLPDTSNASWDSYWDLDDGIDDGPSNPLPPYFIGGSGGGRGGYSWGGDGTRQVGGMGGRPLNNDPGSQLFLGGGGGAGEENNDVGTAGADGGGLVVIGAGSISGSGQIIANGNNSSNASNDGAGGAGAGGTIVIQTGDVSGVNLEADGGNGGNAGHGAGGGGGGGFIVLDANSGTLSTSVSGGINGISGENASFLPYGTTIGYDGGTSSAGFTFPGCSTPTAIILQSITAQSNFGMGNIALLASVGLLGSALIFFCRVRRT